MKLKHALIENFKVVKKCEIDFVDNALPRQITAVLGDNGSGKTTVLQAIALVLSLASRKTASPDLFRWHGFLPERISSLGATNVELTVSFDDDELTTTQCLYDNWLPSLPATIRDANGLIKPSNNSEVRLIFRDGRLTSPDGTPALHQFAGRFYISALSKTQPEVREYYRSIGSVFWFDQMRNLGQLLSTAKDDENNPEYSSTWQSGVEQLREFLVGWWAHHTSARKRGFDYIPSLKDMFNLVFPGVEFTGVQPKGSGMGRVSDFYFLLKRGGTEFDISEMSSGEQAVFPLIYEFVRLSIAKSIVLIDELELHLHPPQQQALLASLPKIGPDCQFIITTHSPHLESAIPDEYEIRLDGGRLCL